MTLLLRTTARRTYTSSTRQVINKRFQSTSTSSTTKPADSSHVLAGLGGGAVVLSGVYAYYHYSGIASVVSTTQSTINQAKSAKDKLLSATPSTTDALNLLRTAAHTYAGTTIPGSKQIIDKTFDELDELNEKYGEKLSVVLKESYDELKEITNGENLKDGGDKLMKYGFKLIDKIKVTVEEKGGDVLDKLLKENPELKKSLGGSLDELKSLGDKYGPEVQSLLTSTYSSLASTVASKGLSPSTIPALQSILTEKSKEIKELVNKSTSEAYEKLGKDIGPILEGLGKDGEGLKKVLDDKINGLEGWVGEERVEVIKSLYSQLSDLSKSSKGKSPEELTKEAKKIIEKQFGSLDELKDKATSFVSSNGGNGISSTAMSYLGGATGLGGLGKMINLEELKHLKELAEKHGSEGEKLLEGTYDEIKQLLKKKLEEGKKVLGDAKKDVESKSGKDDKEEKKDDKKANDKKDDKKSEKKDDKKGKDDTKSASKSSDTPSKKN